MTDVLLDQPTDIERPPLDEVALGLANEQWQAFWRSYASHATKQGCDALLSGFPASAYEADTTIISFLEANLICTDYLEQPPDTAWETPGVAHEDRVIARWQYIDREPVYLVSSRSYTPEVVIETLLLRQGELNGQRIEEPAAVAPVAQP